MLKRPFIKLWKRYCTWRYDKAFKDLQDKYDRDLFGHKSYHELSVKTYKWMKRVAQCNILLKEW